MSFNPPQAFQYTSPELRGPSTAVPPSPPSPFTRNEPWGFESPSGDYYERICTVIGLYDYSSSDPDHLSFRKHDILEIVRQDELGWWGAVRSDGSEIGWIPAKFVRALSDDAAHRVYEIRERTQIPQFLADTDNVGTAPPLSIPIVEPSTPSSGTAVPDSEPSDTAELSPPPPWSDLSIVVERPREPTAIQIPVYVHDSPPNSVLHEVEDSPVAPVSLTLVPPVSQWPKPFLKLDKSLPASPDGTTSLDSAGAEPKISAHRRNSSDSAVGSPDSLFSLPGPSTVRAQISDHFSPLVSSLDVPPSPFLNPFPPNARPRPGKILQLTGDDSAQAFHNAKQAQANLPWYLKHRHSDEEIKLEFDGTVKAGTLPALVEHLVVDALRENRFSALQLPLSDCFVVAGASQQEIFRRAFLVTFRTFATATEVFDLLVAQYEMCVPPNLSEEEFKRWKRDKQRPTQKRVLTVLTMWLEEYDLLNQDPEVPPKLQDFLGLIVHPPALELTAKHILKSLERLVGFNCILFFTQSFLTSF
jgi:son of sevenless